MSDPGMVALGCIVLFLSSALCSSAGVGGGTLNVPILINIFGFDYSTAVVLSLSTLMGNYLLQTLINLDKRHPTSPTKPLIYWDAVLILLPSELGGSNIGVIIEQIMPTTYLYIIALIVLIIAGAMTLNKGIHLYEEETHAHMDVHSTQPLLRENHQSSYNTSAEDLKAGAAGVVDPEEPSVTIMQPKQQQKTMTEVITSIIPPYLYCYAACCRDDANRTISDMDDETERLPISQPWLVIKVVMAVWCLYAICYVVMNEFDSCSVGYYVVLGIIYPLLIIEVFWGVNYLHYIQKADPESIAEGDINWNASAYLMAFFAFIIGILTSLLGIGGGELMGPMMLLMKVLPLVSSATTSVMSLLNSSSSILHHLVIGDVPYGYAALTFIIGAAGGITGRLTGLFVSHYYGRTSFLVFALVAVLFVSFVVYIAYIFTEDVDVTFGSLCN